MRTSDTLAITYHTKMNVGACFAQAKDDDARAAADAALAAHHAAYAYVPAAAVGGAGAPPPERDAVPHAVEAVYAPIDLANITTEALSTSETLEAVILAAREDNMLLSFVPGHTPNARQEAEGDQSFIDAMRDNGDKPGTSSVVFAKGNTIYVKYYALDRSTWQIQYMRRPEGSWFLGGAQELIPPPPAGDAEYDPGEENFDANVNANIAEVIAAERDW
jgi:hypothetical protein